MQLPQICLLNKIPRVFIVLISMFFCSCAELDGVFPKFEPQKKVEEKVELPTSSSVIQKQTLISEENRILQKKLINYNGKYLIYKENKKYIEMSYFCYKSNGK